MPFIPCPPLARFQFTPLREGRRRKHLSCTQVSRFFQFTPLREGRRFPAPAVLKIRPISIHAPPRGATRRRSLRSSNKPDFNSRPSARGDDLLRLDKFDGYISIHAPPRGATPTSITVCLARTFQFTPLREGRRRRILPPIIPSHFNSRPSARGDKMNGYFCSMIRISIHAPPRGATNAK